MNNGRNNGCCPTFSENPETIAKILRWAGAQIKFTGEWVNTLTGEKRQIAGTGNWAAILPEGSLSYTWLDEDNYKEEERAQMITAMFVYLRSVGVDLQVAILCMVAVDAFDGGIFDEDTRYDWVVFSPIPAGADPARHSHYAASRTPAAPITSIRPPAAKTTKKVKTTKKAKKVKK